MKRVFTATDENDKTVTLIYTGDDFDNMMPNEIYKDSEGKEFVISSLKTGRFWGPHDIKVISRLEHIKMSSIIYFEDGPCLVKSIEEKLHKCGLKLVLADGNESNSGKIRHKWPKH